MSRRLRAVLAAAALTAAGCSLHSAGNGEASAPVVAQASRPASSATIETTTTTTTTAPATSATVETTTTQAPVTTIETTTTTTEVPRPLGEVEPGQFVGTATINISRTGETITQDIYVSEHSADIAHDPSLDLGLMAHFDRAIPGINEPAGYPAVFGGHRTTEIDATADDTDKKVSVLRNIHLITPGSEMQIVTAAGETMFFEAVTMTAEQPIKVESGLTVNAFNVPAATPGEVRVYACTGAGGVDVAAAAQAGEPIHDRYIDGGQSPSYRYIVTFEQVYPEN